MTVLKPPVFLIRWLFFIPAMRKLLLIVCMFCTFNPALNAQTLTYAIRLKDELVGKMTANRQGKSKTSYFIESNILVQKMLLVDIRYTLESVFENNILMSSQAINKLNGKEQANSKTRNTKNGYTVQTLKGTKKLSQSEIPYNLCSLYFEEPVKYNSVYSDTYGEFLPLKPAGPHRYELILPDGKSNYYTYQHGICVLVELEILFGKITFHLTRN